MHNARLPGQTGARGITSYEYNIHGYGHTGEKDSTGIEKSFRKRIMMSRHLPAKYFGERIANRINEWLHHDPLLCLVLQGYEA